MSREKGDSGQEVYTAYVQPSEAGKRLDKFWSDRLVELGHSRSKIRGWVQAGQALIDGQTCRQGKQRVQNGQRATISLPKQVNGLTVDPGPVQLVYFDLELLVVNKPAGLTVHPGASRKDGTLVQRLAFHFPQLLDLEGERPGIVHRLDKDTSGLLVVALNERARLGLGQAFAQRKVEKEYLALVHGQPEGQGEVRLPIGRDPRYRTRMAVCPKTGREAYTRFTRVWSSPDQSVSLLRVRILTGRTHQIRVHLAHLGHPLVGDQVYGPQAQARLLSQRPWIKRLLGRQMLHAWRLGFVHPKTGEQIQCTQAMPKAMWRLVLILGRRLQRVGLTGMPGAGKTSFLQTLSDQGLPVWSADQEVRALYAPGADGTIMLRRRFGDEVLDERGAVDKVVLIGLMQGSSAVSREVQQLIHPLVSHRLEQFWAESSQARVAVAEVPLLFESESFEGRRFEVIIGLFCPRSLRSSRLKAFRGWDSETLDYLESGQWTAGAKLRGCQLIVVNDGDLETLGRRAKVVETILRRLRRKVLRDLYQGLQGYLLSRVKKGD